MKCAACNYEQGWRGVEEINPDGIKFIRINGDYSIDKCYNKDEVYLFACPICGTVRIEKYL